MQAVQLPSRLHARPYTHTVVKCAAGIALLQRMPGGLGLGSREVEGMHELRLPWAHASRPGCRPVATRQCKPVGSKKTLSPSPSVLQVESQARNLEGASGRHRAAAAHTAVTVFLFSPAPISPIKFIFCRAGTQTQQYCCTSARGCVGSRPYGRRCI